jgi:cold shock CspA family protein
MRGTMIWFNGEKGFGFIQTEDDERLYVGEAGFTLGNVPVGRCGGREVTFERMWADEGKTRAVNVAFPSETQSRRARQRRYTSGRSL